MAAKNKFFSFSKRVKYVPLFFGIIFISSIILSFFYSIFNQNQPKKLIVSEPNTKIAISENSFDNDYYIVRFSDTSLSLPKNWVPIMDLRKKAFYIAQSETESLDLIDCANKSSCENYFLEITLGDMRTVIDDDPIRYLKSGTSYYNGFSLYTDGKYDIFYGNPPKCYTDSQGFIPVTCSDNYSGGMHYIVFSEDKNNYVDVFLASTETNIDLNFLLTNFDLDQLFIERINYYELPKTRAYYNLTIESSLITSDFSKLRHLMSNYLPTENTRDYNSLFFEYKGNIEQNNYPRDNFFNANYILSTTNTNLKSGLYGTNQIKILVEEKKNFAEFDNYTRNVKYCSTDNDCVYRQYSCSFNAYNKYLLVNVEAESNCANYNIAGLGSQRDLSVELSCTPKAVYDDIKCIQSQCELIKPQIVCKQ